MISNAIKIGNKLLKIQNHKLKIRLKNVIFLLLLPKNVFHFWTTARKPKRILVIEVGHRVKDAGAIYKSTITSSANN